MIVCTTPACQGWSPFPLGPPAFRAIPKQVRSVAPAAAALAGPCAASYGRLSGSPTCRSSRFCGGGLAVGRCVADQPNRASFFAGTGMRPP